MERQGKFVLVSIKVVQFVSHYNVTVRVITPDMRYHLIFKTILVD